MNTRFLTASEVKPYVTQGEAELLTFDKLEKTLYIGGFVDETLVGFVGILFSGGRTFFKNDYVLPQHRGQGHYRALFQARLDTCRKMGIRSATAFCTAMSLPTYRAFGAKVGKTRGLTTYVTLPI